MRGSEGALGPPAWSELQSPLGIWVYAAGWGVCFYIQHLLENTVWGTSQLWDICGFIYAKTHKGKAPGPEGSRKAVHADCPGDSTVSSAEVWGGWALSGNHGEEFQRAEGQKQRISVPDCTVKIKALSRRDSHKDGSINFQQRCKGNSVGKG